MIYGRLETARLFYPTGNAVVQKNKSPSSDCTDIIEVVQQELVKSCYERKRKKIEDKLTTTP